MNTDLVAAARQIRAVRNAVTRRLVRKIQPWLLPSDFADPDDVGGKLHLACTSTGCIDAPHACFEVSRSFTAFTRAGILDSDYTVAPFSALCVDDLIEIERALDRVLRRSGFVKLAKKARPTPAPRLRAPSRYPPEMGRSA